VSRKKSNRRVRDGAIVATINHPVTHLPNTPIRTACPKSLASRDAIDPSTRAHGRIVASKRATAIDRSIDRSINRALDRADATIEATSRRSTRRRARLSLSRACDGRDVVVTSW